MNGDVDARQVGGLGLFLLRELADELLYHHDPASGWNELVVIKGNGMVDLMRPLTIFKGFSADDLAQLAARMYERRLQAGEVLFAQGDAGHECFVILSGEVEVVGRQRHGEVRLQIARAGQVVGEMALLDTSPRSATVRALSPSLLAAMDEDAFVALMHSNPEWTLNLLRDSTTRLRGTSYQMISELEAKNAELTQAYHELKAAQAERIRLSRLDEELAVARRIQELFLPQRLPQPAGWQIAAFSRGAQAVGGDFFDCIELPGGQLGLVVADVCGKGVPAALFVALTRSLLRASTLAPWAFGRGEQAAEEVLAGALWFTNDYIASEHGESNMFITLFYGVLDPASGALHYANAGHNPPLIVSAGVAAEGTGQVRELESSALPLGILGGQTYETLRAGLAPGELLLSFSDGITEAMSAGGEPFGDARLAAVLCEQASLPATDLVAAIVGAVDAFAAGATQADDMTLLLVKRLF
jgi:sigma-B regulation protein RsbU (phosphoserine phosphatase)